MVNGRKAFNLFYIFLTQIFIYNCSNIIVFDSFNYRSGHFAFKSNGDMIIEYSYENNRLFYGLKANGKYFFKDSSQNQVPTKEISFENGNNRYEAKNIFVSINDKEYLFSISTFTTFVELIDLDEENNLSYKLNSVETFLGNNVIFSYVFSLLKMDTTPQQYLISYTIENKYQLQKFYFSNFGLQSTDFVLTTTIDSYETEFKNRIVSCFIIESDIIVFLVGYTKENYLLYAYDFDLRVINNNNIPVVDTINNFNDGYGIFSKAFYLENRDAIFIYFTSPGDYALKLKTGTVGEQGKSFIGKTEKSINEYNFNFDVRLNDFVKIDSKRFIYIGLPKDDYKSIYVILFDLYNNYQSMNMRIYQNNFDNNHEINTELSADIYNDLLIFTSTCINSLGVYSILMIFGYANYTDNAINISQYFMDDDENNPNNIFDILLQGIQIENNIFNYHLVQDEIKLISIPDELYFFNKNTGSEISISIGDNLNRIYSIKQNQNKGKTSDYYSLDFQPIIEEPDTANYNLGTIKFYPESPNNDFQSNYRPKRYYGRSITVTFKLCHRFCETCKKYGISDDSQLCLSCLPDYRYYNEKQFISNCVPEGYFFDYDNGGLIQCNNLNSKFYINLTDNNRICFKINDSCPEEYPFYNETNRECINYTSPTTIITYIPKIPTTIPVLPTTLIQAPTTIPKIPTTLPLIPTTIIQIPTTLPLTPTTMIQIPTTLPLIPTTIIHMPTTIPLITTTIPLIQTTLPLIPSTIITSFPKILTTVPEVPTEFYSTISLISSISNKPSTYMIKIPTTILTTIITTTPITEAIDSSFCSYYDILNDKCSFINMTNIDIYNIIKKEILSSYPKNGQSVVIHAKDDYVFHVTNNINELSTLNGSLVNGYNLSIIDLAECESAIREANNINDDTPLNLLKFEKLSNLSIQKNVQYEIFAFNSSKKLNLSVCKDKPVDIYIPIELNELTKLKYEDLKAQGYDLFDKKSSFYTDICTPYDSPNGTDVALSTRNSEFYNSTETSCQANCEYGDYISESSYLKCVCSVVEEDINLEQPEKYTGKVFAKSFYDVLKNSNYEIVKCYRLVFRLNNFISNIGCIISISLFLLYSISLILYICTGITKFRIDISKILVNDEKKENTLEDNIDNIINEDKNNVNIYLSKKERKNKNKTKAVHFVKDIKEPKKEKFKKNVNMKHYQSEKIINIKKKSKLKSNQTSNTESEKKKIFKSENVNSPPRKISSNKESDKTNKIKNDISIGKTSNSNNSNLNLKNNIILLNNNLFQGGQKVIKKPKSIFSKMIKNNNEISITPKKVKNIDKIKKDQKFSNYELNDMEYLEAVKHDKRQFHQIYWSILSREHLIIFTFFHWNDHNINSIKLSRFFFLVCTDMAMNVFFFTDESMHKIYKSYGKWDFLQNIPQIIYSTLISQALEIFICFLTLTDKHFYQIKQIKFESINSMIPVFKIMNCIKIKLGIFYIFTFILFFSYWYIVTAFCSVYRNTQIIFIKDSIFSFIGGILYPFGLYFISALLRIISLKSKKGNLGCIYKLSEIIPFF